MGTVFEDASPFFKSKHQFEFCYASDVRRVQHMFWEVSTRKFTREGGVRAQRQDSPGRKFIPRTRKK